MPSFEPWVIRPARASERSALEALQWRASLVWEAYREQLLANPDAIDIPAEHLHTTDVAERQAQLLGFVTVLMGAQGGDAELDGLFVEPTQWRQGVGRSLVDAAQARARAGGAGALHVIANPLAQDFYTSLGFLVVGEHQTRFGPAPTMRLPL